MMKKTKHIQIGIVLLGLFLIGQKLQAQQVVQEMSLANALATGLENNYPTSVRLIFCGQNAHTQQGEVSLTKAIQGDEFFYIIRLEKKIAVFEPGEPDFDQQEMAQWSTYLKRISLCNTNPKTENTHQCPSSEGGQ